jgi:hypothetical protein
VLISEFLNTDQLEEIENEQVEELIIKWLSQIHVVYGYNLEWNDTDTWMFDELNEKEESLSSINTVEFITDINNSFVKMTNSVMMGLYQLPTLFQYKKRTLFTLNNKVVVDINHQITPLLLAMRDLTRVYKEETPNNEVMITVNKLVDCCDKVFMMVALNNLWILETTRNVNKTIESRLTTFDKKPVNVIRRGELDGLVITLLLDNETLTVEQIRKQVVGDYSKLLNKLYNKGDISDEDVGDSEDVCKVSKSVMVRWIKYTKTIFDEAED